MNQNQKALVDALRSGEYEQGEGLLRPRSNQFCCLGVGCDISKLGKWEKRHDTEYEYVINNFPSAIQFPQAVADYFGFEPSEALKQHRDWNDYKQEHEYIYNYNYTDPLIIVLSRVIDDDKLIRCSRANDDGYTFEEIADAIEYTYA